MVIKRLISNKNESEAYRMKKTYFLSITLFMFVFLLGLTPRTGAAENGRVLPPPDQLSANPLSSIVINVHEDLDYSSRMPLIREWRTSLTNNQNGIITIMGQTKALKTVENLELQLSLQYWDGSNWVDVTSRNISKQNSSSITEIFNSSVNNGYYRTHCIHTVKDAGITEVQESVSESILIP